MVADVRPISRTSPSTCQKIKYSNRNGTLGSCPTPDYRWSATQPRVLAPHRLGLRAGEVAQLQLDDIDWRNAVVRVRARKTGHGALLPLPVDVGAAVADYLQHARPNTATRQVFVLQPRPRRPHQRSRCRSAL